MTDPATIIKKLIPLADAHRKADDYVAGDYGNRTSSKACAIGCTINDARKLGILPDDIHNDDHPKLAAETGVPEVAWLFLDVCFEGLPEAERSKLPPRFLRAAAKGTRFATLPARISCRCLHKLVKDAISDEVREVAEILLGLYRRWSRRHKPSRAQWTAAWNRADAARSHAAAARSQSDAAWNQTYAAWNQAYAARNPAEAAWNQAYAARSQAYAARSQAYAARNQADAATRNQANAAWSQANAARSHCAAWIEFWRWCADMLCEEVAK